MKTIVEQLPKAIRWSNILMWFLGVVTVVMLIGAVLALIKQPVVGILVLVATAFVGVQFWLMRNYKNACKEAYDSERPADLEVACQAQTSLVKFYGILTLVMIVLVAFGIVFGLSSYQNYISRTQAIQMQR